jgi:hypothetical protein
MGYKVTKDSINAGEEVTLDNRVYDGEYEGGGHMWRLLDDDGVVYLNLVSDTDPEDCGEEDGFAPLDRFQGSYGCTEIQYFDENQGKWRTL